MSYLNHFGLLRSPFAGSSTESFYSAPPQREALAGLSYFVASDWNSAFLVAPSRSGMTALLRQIKRMNGFGDIAAEVVLTDGWRDHTCDVEMDLASALGLESGSEHDSSRIGEAIDATAEQGIRTVWLIDQCHCAAAQVARHLLQSSSELSVVMGVLPDRLATVTAQFGRCCMRVDLEPLGLDETVQYVHHCLEHVGCRAAIFSDSAIVRLHEIAKGRLKDLSELAESAMELAARHDLEQINPALVEAASERGASSRFAQAG